MTTSGIPVEDGEDWSADRLEREVLAFEREWLAQQAASGGDGASDAEPTRPVPKRTTATDDFQYDDKGRRYKSRHNVREAFRQLGVRVRYNEFADEEVIDGLEGFGPVLDDPTYIRLWLLIEERFSFRLDKGFFYDVVSDIARDDRFNPVRDYLHSVRWDGEERLSYWLIDHFHAADTDFTRAISRIVLIAAVRRALHPGCKFDEMLILESEQGFSKSTAIRSLVPTDDLFGDNLPLTGDTKVAMEQMAGKWIVEAGELNGMSRGDLNALKQFMARQEDEARLSYGRKRSKRKRQCIFIGTTNELGGYLRDRTGNRRFWPVRVGEVNIEGLRANRDQLWAEAVAAEANGESIRLDRSLWLAAADEQAARTVEDPFELRLREGLGDLTGKIHPLDCYAIVGLDPADATDAHAARLHVTMLKLGWERKRARFVGHGEHLGDDNRDLGYVRGNALERHVQLVLTGDKPPKATKSNRNGGMR